MLRNDEVATFTHSREHIYSWSHTHRLVCVIAEIHSFVFILVRVTVNLGWDAGPLLGTMHTHSHLWRSQSTYQYIVGKKLENLEENYMDTDIVRNMLNVVPLHHSNSRHATSIISRISNMGHRINV